MNQRLHFSEAVLNQKIFTPFYKGVKPAVEITGDSAYETVIEMKTFGQILEEIDWPPVWEQLQKLYQIPDEGKPAYKRAFDEVRGLSPAATALKIEIKEYDPSSEESGGCQFGVSGVDENGAGGIEYVPWSQWKGMGIMPETLERFSAAEIAAHCLEEMTFAGFSQKDVSEKLNDMGVIRKDDPQVKWKLFKWRMKNLFARPYKIHRHKPRETFIDEPPVEYLDAEICVPEEINPNGLYAIFLLQAEMYDLGNKEFIGHYLIYDERKQKAVDVTAHIRQAPLLSAIPEGKVIDDCSDIRALLHKKRTPQYTDNQSVKKFIALELTLPVSEQIRDNLAALVDLDKTREVFLNQFVQNLGAVRDVFFSNPRVNPQDDTMVQRLEDMKAGKGLTMDEAFRLTDEE